MKMIVEDRVKDNITGGKFLAQRIRVFLIRHGQVEGHQLFRFNGHTDVALTPVGVQQIENLSGFLSRFSFDHIYCSDLTRCRVGADILARGRNVEPIIHPGLREMYFGRLEGLSHKEVTEQYPSFFDEWWKDIENYRLPEGERFRDQADRVLGAMDDIREGNEGKTILIMAHGGSNRIIISQALNMDLRYAFRIEQDYACVNVIDYFPEWNVVKVMNWQPTNSSKGA